MQTNLSNPKGYVRFSQTEVKSVDKFYMDELDTTTLLVCCAIAGNNNKRAVKEFERRDLLHVTPAEKFNKLFFSEEIDWLNTSEDFVKRRYIQFVREERDTVRETIFSSFVNLGVITEDLRSEFWHKPEDHNKMKKPYHTLYVVASDMLQKYQEAVFTDPEAIVISWFIGRQMGILPGKFSEARPAPTPTTVPNKQQVFSSTVVNDDNFVVVLPTTSSSPRAELDILSAVDICRCHAECLAKGEGLKAQKLLNIASFMIKCIDRDQYELVPRGMQETFKEPQVEPDPLMKKLELMEKLHLGTLNTTEQSDSSFEEKKNFFQRINPMRTSSPAYQKGAKAPPGWAGKQ